MKESVKSSMASLPLKSKSKKTSPQIIVNRAFAGTYSLSEAIFSIAKMKIEAGSAKV